MGERKKVEDGLVSFLDELRQARSIADVSIAAGAAYNDLIEAEKKPRRANHLLAAVLVIAGFLAVSMAFHPGAHLDHLATAAIRDLT